MKKCPYCAEEIQDEAIVCRYCGRDLRLPVDQPVVPTVVAVPVATATPEDVELMNLEDRRKQAEAALSDAKGARTIGLAGVLAGLILLFILPLLGVLLIVAGGLAAITQMAKVEKRRAEIEELTKQIAERHTMLPTDSK